MIAIKDPIEIRFTPLIIAVHLFAASRSCNLNQIYEKSRRRGYQDLRGQAHSEFNICMKMSASKNSVRITGEHL